MVVDKTVWIAIGAVIVLYLLYKLFFGKDRDSMEFERAYHKILHSEEYKVKGQHDK